MPEVDLEKEVELTPVGLRGNRGAILNINASRARAVYYRPDGHRTGLLPADPFSIAYYFAKGFTARPPKPVVLSAEKTEFTLTPNRNESIAGCVCSTCGFIAKTDFGLQVHIRRHKGEPEQGLKSK